MIDEADRQSAVPRCEHIEGDKVAAIGTFKTVDDSTTAGLMAML
jgi:hypothetical protein